MVAPLRELRPSLRRLLLATAGALAFLVICTAILLLATAEPRYKGRSLSSWVNMDIGRAPEASRAILEMGERALRAAVKKIGTKASSIFPHWTLQKLGIDVGIDNPAQVARNQQAIGYWVVCVLREKAAPIIPQLTNYLSDPELAVTASDALQAIGEEARPSILQCIASSNAVVRASAVGCLAGMGGSGAEELLRLTTNADPALRAEAYFYLPGVVHRLPKQALATMKAGVDDTNVAAACKAAIAMRFTGDFGTNLLPKLYEVRGRSNVNPSLLADVEGSITNLEKRMRFAAATKTRWGASGKF